jgi:hypothetical protein
MKIIPYFVVGILLFSVFTAVNIKGEAGEQITRLNMSFFEPIKFEREDFVELEVKGTNNYLFNSGKPMLPIYTRTLILPFGVKVKQVTCDVQNTNTIILEDKIMPAPQYYRKDMIAVSNEIKMDETVYNSDVLYPSSWFNYDVGVGLDDNMEHKTFITINAYPLRYNPVTDTVIYVDDIEFELTYDFGSNPFPTNIEYNMVIIAPSKFTEDLQPLINHKNNVGVETVLKTTEEILSEYSGVDEPEKIKFFIKDAVENWGVTYICLVGGLKSLIYAKPRDDLNQGTSKWWYVPVRYSNLIEGEPGYCCDLYYADIYKEGGEFDNWDSNGNGIFAEWKGIKRDSLDLFPDVAIGRLGCRNSNEVKIIVDKIINYETNADPSWFEKMIVVSGDGFLDQFDLDIQWDTNQLPNGDYTIYAQSENPEGIKGPIDEIPIKIDRTQETRLTFNHDDHLTTGLIYPYDPIAEIVSVSDGDILGDTDYSYTPKGSEAYLNSNLHWANIEFIDGILHIRGKTYDPKPYGYTTDLKIWIKNSAGEIVFQDERLDSQTYFEGEWTTGEQLLKDRGGGLFYMPDKFDRELLWTSNGKWTDQSQVIREFSNGAGFVFFSGHGSPGWWGNHYPGIPGNRHKGETEGLLVYDWNGPPYLPMDQLTNDYKNPVVVVGGCHNSDFNVSLIPTILDNSNQLMTHCYGRPTAECWSWYLTSLSKRGAIACMGNTGYGYGILNEYCTTGGLDNWITTEFFRQYGTQGHEILGDAYAQTLNSYINVFRTIGHPDPSFRWDSGHEKTVQQWVLHGDPSLKIGGYSNQKNVEILIYGGNSNADGYPNENLIFQAIGDKQYNYEWKFDMDGDGEYDEYIIGDTVNEKWSTPGVYKVELKASLGEEEIISNTIVDIENEPPNKPDLPQGPTEITRKTICSYQTSSIDPNGDQLYYFFDWGDDSISYSGPHKSGETGNALHEWTEQGTYKLKVGVFDSDAKWSGWSDILTITVSGKKTKDYTIYLDFLYNFLEQHPNLFPILRQISGK